MKITTIRSDKYLSSLGLASRRGVEEYIKHNNITADGEKILGHGQRIPIHSVIRINGNKLTRPKKVYFLLNKPRGIVSTSADEFGRRNVVNLVKTKERIFPVGRLDRDTHGLIILTNDGQLTNMLIHPKYHVGKSYLLKIKGQVNPLQIEKLKDGIMLEDGLTQPTKVFISQRRKDVTVIEMTIFEGKKRQIRRMCEEVKLQLVDLQRIRFGNIDLGELKIGEFRELTGREVESLKKLTQKKNE